MLFLKPSAEGAAAAVVLKTAAVGAAVGRYGSVVRFCVLLCLFQGQRLLDGCLERQSFVFKESRSYRLLTQTADERIANEFRTIFTGGD